MNYTFVKVFVVFTISSFFVTTLGANLLWIDNQNRINECYLEPNGTLINDPSSCAAYFLCIGGYEFSLDCPNSLQFNPVYNFCDTEINVRCEDPVETTPNPICNGKDHLSFIDNVESCAAYFLCYNEIAIEVQCPPPLHFNPIISECDIASNCTDPITPPPSSELCLDIPNGGFVNNETTCAAYFVCLNGVALSRNCPEGYYFDTITSNCNIAEFVNCTDPAHICDGKEDFSFVNDPSSCEGYFVCINGTEISTNCPPPLVFDYNLLQCDHPDNFECYMPNLACKGVSNGALVNDNSSCEGFFLCINDQAINQFCPETFHFDPVNGKCIEENLSDCSVEINVCLGMPDRTMINDPSSCAAYFICIGEIVNSVTCPNPMYFNPITKQCDSKGNVDCDDFNPDDICAGVPDMAFIPSPYSCTHFFQCISGFAFPFECPYPMLFNPEKSECDAKDNVDCENNSTTDSTLETTTLTETTEDTTDSTITETTEITDETTEGSVTGETTTLTGTTEETAESTLTETTEETTDITILVLSSTIALDQKCYDKIDQYFLGDLDDHL